MSMTVGVREFREALADYIDQTEPVTVTRHGQAVALFIPVRRDKAAERAAYVDAVQKANALLTQMGMTEDMAISEFNALRRANVEQEQ